MKNIRSLQNGVAENSYATKIKFYLVKNNCFILLKNHFVVLLRDIMLIAMKKAL